MVVLRNAVFFIGRLEIGGLVARAVVVVVAGVALCLFVEKHNFEVSAILVFIAGLWLRLIC